MVAGAGRFVLVAGLMFAGLGCENEEFPSDELSSAGGGGDGVVSRRPSGGLADGGTCATTGLSQCGDLCVDLQADEQNCGACGVACVQGERCTAGACGTQCTAGQRSCDGSCVDLATDVNNCGGCGRRCPAGNVCVGGVCSLTCEPGRVSCGGACVDLRTDEANCGVCGNICTAVTQQCVDGACR